MKIFGATTVNGLAVLKSTDAAGGGLGGTYPNPTVVGTELTGLLNASALTTYTDPSSYWGYVLASNGWPADGIVSGFRKGLLGTQRFQGTGTDLTYSRYAITSGTAWSTWMLYPDSGDFPAKGSLLTGTGVNTYGALTVGNDNSVLTADSSKASGFRFGGGNPTTITWEAGTSSAQKIVLGTPTAGTFTITFGGQTTTAIAWNASAATVQAALVALTSIGANNVLVYVGAPTIIFVFSGTMAAAPQATVTGSAASLTGGSFTASSLQTGVVSTSDVSTKLAASIIFSNPSGNTVTDWQRNIVNYVTTSSGTVTGPNRLRITPKTGEAGSNTRVVSPIAGSLCVDSEIRSIWYGHSGTGAGHGQFGHAHRLTATGNGGKPWTYMAWQDIVASDDASLNMNSWTTNGATPPDLTQGVGLVNRQFNNLFRRWPYLAASVSGTTLTVTIPPNTYNGVGRPMVGDTISILGGSDADTFGAVTISAVGNTWFQAPTSSTPAPSFGTGPPGYYQFGAKIMPYWVCSRLIGNVLRVKAWRYDQPEPDWSDEVANEVEPIFDGPTVGTTGYCGIYAGHLTTPVTNWLEYGSVTWKSLD